MLRLPYDATTKQEVEQYYKVRALQLASEGFYWDRKLQDIPGGYKTSFWNVSTQYDSTFILAQHRGKGHAVRAARALNNPVITIDDCEVVAFLKRAEIPHIVISGIFDTPEYKMIESYYGSQTAKRSGVFKMNHIDEGLFILKNVPSTTQAKLAFCLHPLVQDDEDLKLNLDTVMWSTNPHVLALALEYRSFANAYLSKRSIKSIAEIAMSPLHEVKDMLIADKVQNYKDFIRYHDRTHPRSAELHKYFNNWLNKLGISQSEFQTWVQIIDGITQ